MNQNYLLRQIAKLHSEFLIKPFWWGEPENLYFHEFLDDNGKGTIPLGTVGMAPYIKCYQGKGKYLNPEPQYLYKSQSQNSNDDMEAETEHL